LDQVALLRLHAASYRLHQPTSPTAVSSRPRHALPCSASEPSSNAGSDAVWPAGRTDSGNTADVEGGGDSGKWGFYTRNRSGRFSFLRERKKTERRREEEIFLKWGRKRTGRSRIFKAPDSPHFQPATLMPILTVALRIFRRCLPRLWDRQIRNSLHEREEESARGLDIMVARFRPLAELTDIPGKCLDGEGHAIEANAENSTTRRPWCQPRRPRESQEKRRETGGPLDQPSRAVLLY
jgi:hypothetical protein